MKLVYTIKYSKVARIHRVLSFFGGGGAGGGGGGCEEVNAKGMRQCREIRHAPMGKR